jgi:sugar/nucleoside kinase (ribokinase family)
MAGVDLIFCNKDEAMAFIGTHSLEAAPEGLIQYTATLTITDDPGGAVPFDGQTMQQSDGVDAIAFDTNGSGDVFSGTFLYAMTSRRYYAWAADFANDCVAKTVAWFGRRLEAQQFGHIKTKFFI